MTTNHRIVYANGDKVRTRLFDMGVSEREFARRTNLGGGTVRALLRSNQINSSAQLADVYRGLAELGFTPGQLLDPPVPVEPDDTIEADIHTLAGLLHSESIMQSHERLALALQWTLDRVRDTLTALDARLRPAGLCIHQTYGTTQTVTIRPIDDSATPARERLTHLTDAQNGMNRGTARTLYAVYTGTISKNETRNDHLVQLGALRNRGAIGFGTGDDRFHITDDVAFAFDIT